MRIRFPSGAVLVFLFSYAAIAETGAIQAMTTGQMVRSGREAFVNRCSGCHGQNGDGNGPAATMLNPRPRNLLEGSFKFRSTPSGVLPTVEDLLRTLEQGIPGSAMPSFSDLASAEKLALVAYIRSLRPEFRESRAEQVSINLPPVPREMLATKAELLKAARKGQVHFKLACVNCHGESGRGDGPSAAELTDSDNQPIRPANLRLPRIKSGVTARDLFRAISTGLDGSPMPGFESLFNETQRWELVAYVFALRGVDAGIYTEKEISK